MRDTSADAYASVKDRISAMQTQLLVALRASSTGASADQLASMTGLGWSNARKRLSELAKAGMVEDSGKRAVNASGRRAIVWRAKSNA